MTNQEVMVVKYGSSSVTNNQGMDTPRIDGYVAQLEQFYDSFGLIIVSSGSIAVGKTIWKAQSPGIDYPENQPLAMLGSAGAFTSWQNSFNRIGILAGQLLISHREIDDSREGPMLNKALKASMNAGIVTVANENDAVSDEEIRKRSYGGDNDGMASRLARLVEAQYLLLMTDQEGVLDADGKLIRLVSKSNISDVCIAAGGPGEKGRGGMYEKVRAARKAAVKGVNAFIGHSDADIQAILAHETGTSFVPY